MSSHPSKRPTWISAGNLQTIRFGLASGGVCPAAVSPRRWCALTAPFHPCLPAVHVGRPTSAVCFCGTFPRVSPGRYLDHLALWCPDFPRRPLGPRGCLTCACHGSALRAQCKELRNCAPRCVQAHRGEWTRVHGRDQRLRRSRPELRPGAQTLLSRPTTRPSTFTFLLRIGSIVSFAGCSLM